MTSKLGLPEVSSMTAFCRCCCSGMTSDSSFIPVRSVNSDAYFCSSSPRGPLIRLASIVVPAYFFHCGSARAGNPGRLSALAASVPCNRERRGGAQLAMSLSSLQSAFDGDDYLTDAFGGSRAGACLFGFIARCGIGTRTSCRVKASCLSRRLRPAHDIDCADVLIYGAPRLTQVKPRDDVFRSSAAAYWHRSVFGDARSVSAQGGAHGLGGRHPPGSADRLFH